ncbi:hypothetical protein SYNTR_0039 [Candidatus Syntrophocurvum alkaliphilum]|uniref:Uncharacterized protein n=1 Tax=Candidatus Syntrophocurvum alkaliphilum TaxID=2293317 RepID=A0A6I6DCL0_9FIRM|nr:hypothetical protein [Candidatus Syntrophocurvum alkaliphilum]QGT98632.1 hypothetical protein SYNTR_0039 [Candidatus Syntrophocurvum alkaliphilum]
MILLTKNILKLFISAMFIILLAFLLIDKTGSYDSNFKLGGYIHDVNYKEEDIDTPVFTAEDLLYDIERFQRPSKESQLELKYTFDIDDFEDKEPYIPKDYPKKFKSSQDVIHAYYSILKEASYMEGYHGGCGTIGWDKIPYPYAYELLSEETKNTISFKKFKNSFKGTGHITALKLYPAYNPRNNDKNIDYNFVEVEVITGPPYSTKSNKKPSYFAYYYGIVTTEYNKSTGWKISAIDYIAEDFLCAPYHFWHWDSKEFTKAVYGGWYSLINEIDNIEIKDPLISIYASKKDKKYKFHFVRLTNGEDILLNEYIYKDEKWEEVNLLNPEHQLYKMSILKFEQKILTK